MYCKYNFTMMARATRWFQKVFLLLMLKVYVAENTIIALQYRPIHVYRTFIAFIVYGFIITFNCVYKNKLSSYWGFSHVLVLHIDSLTQPFTLIADLLESIPHPSLIYCFIKILIKC